MPTDLIITAATIITMDPACPRAEAIGVDTATGRITDVGTRHAVTAAAPDASVHDAGESVLMPGLIDPHSHPILSGIVTQEPSHWIAPYTGYPTFADVQALWHKLNAELPAGDAVMFCGLDRLLQGAPDLTNTDLDGYFPDRPAIVLDNSGHELYFNSATIALNGWADGTPPADPVGASFGRNTDGTSNGRAYETAAILAAASKTVALAVPHPLASAARWYALMARNGITATSEHTYETPLLKAYLALSSVPDTPLRVAFYHMSTEADCDAPLPAGIPDQLVWKQGIKLWADGSPWVGTLAASFPYVDSPTVRTAQIPRGPGGEANMNYSRVDIDAVLDAHARDGVQFAFHVNGDVGLDVVLDAYERALSVHGLLGTDHRWRVEHCGGARRDQLERAARLGVSVSMLVTQFIFWGDLLDGELFAPEIGSQWIRGGDAIRAGAVTSFHNDGAVSPPRPLLNIQTMVTRCTPSGTLHGPEQQVSLHDALKAHTVNAAFHIGREHDLGSITAGKFADLAELSADPYAVDPHRLTDTVTVQGTWLGGRRIDPDAFIDQIHTIDPSEHAELAHKAAGKHSCC